MNYFRSRVAAATVGAGIQGASKLTALGRLAPVAEKVVELNQFNRAASQLSSVGKQNIRMLRGWAKSKGWVRYVNDGRPEHWGIYNPERKAYDWMLRIKAKKSLREGLESGSHLPRFDARLKEGCYINPFTGEMGTYKQVSHIPLEKQFVK